MNLPLSGIPSSLAVTAIGVSSCSWNFQEPPNPPRPSLRRKAGGRLQRRASRWASEPSTAGMTPAGPHRACLPFHLPSGAGPCHGPLEHVPGTAPCCPMWETSVQVELWALGTHESQWPQRARDPTLGQRAGSGGAYLFIWLHRSQHQHSGVLILTAACGVCSCSIQTPSGSLWI